MGRKDTAKNLFHSHTGSCGEISSLCSEGKETEVWSGTFSPGNLGDHFSGSWEAAWIDLGGEG